MDISLDCEALMPGLGEARVWYILVETNQIVSHGRDESFDPENLDEWKNNSTVGGC